MGAACDVTFLTDCGYSYFTSSLPDMRLLAIVTFALACLLSYSTIRAQDTTEVEELVENIEEPSAFKFDLSLNGGATFTSVDQSEEDKNERVQWLSGLRSSTDFAAGGFQLQSAVFAQYGQAHAKGELPSKIQDNLLVSIMPSVEVLSTMGLRLFLETTGETTMGKGDVDGIPTTFLDPLFLYQTLFLGQRLQSESEDGGTSFSMVYGLGYALQQTIATEFILEENRDFVIDENNPLTSVQDQATLESGYSAVFQLEYSNELFENFAFTSSIRSVAMTKDPAIKTITNSRVSALVLGGLRYGIIGADYTLKLTYDKAYSLRRQLDQSLVFGLKLTI